jgi:phage shock protein PspC (stress-responsive transcriptional regulator)
VVTTDSARQGPRGTRVLYVLLGVTIGSFVVLLVAYLLWINAGHP